MKRYDIYIEHGSWVPNEDEEGDWVKYEDVLPLLSEVSAAYAAGFCDADVHATYDEAMKCYEAWQKERVSEGQATDDRA